MAAFSDLLHVRIPNSYEVSNAPDVPSVGLVSSHRVNPGLEYRQRVFLRGPPPGSARPPRLASSFHLKQPSTPLPPASNGELVYVSLTRNAFDAKVTLLLYSLTLVLAINRSHTGAGPWWIKLRVFCLLW